MKNNWTRPDASVFLCALKQEAPSSGVSFGRCKDKDIFLYLFFSPFDTKFLKVSILFY